MAEDEAEIHEGEEPAEAPAPSYERQVELETGRLLPSWISLPLYTFFIFWSVFACAWIAYSMVIQHKILGAIDLIGGPWTGEAPPMDSPPVQDGLDILRKKPRNSALYIIQELRQDAIGDPRMVRAIALRKAVTWVVESRRRALFDVLLEHMNESGEMERGFELPAQHAQALRDFLRGRQEHPSESYEEEKITEVLEWIADGASTPAKGPEKRRIKALAGNYGKKVFFGKEANVLSVIAQEWEGSGEELRRSAAEKFAVMLAGEHAELTPEEAALCEERAEYWQALYFHGHRRLAAVIGELVPIVAREKTRVDHPHLWDLVRLLDMDDEQVRQSVSGAVLALKERKYILIYLSEFLERAAINPVMAVETRRLSKAEHEEELKEELLRRRLASLDVLRQIGLDYCREPFQIEGIAPGAQEEFFRAKVIATLEGVLRDKHKEIRERAASALEELRKACPRYFE